MNKQWEKEKESRNFMNMLNKSILGNDVYMMFKNDKDTKNFKTELWNFQILSAKIALLFGKVTQMKLM